MLMEATFQAPAMMPKALAATFVWALIITNYRKCNVPSTYLFSTLHCT